MASLLMKERNFKYMAEKYSELNDLQVKLGKQLVELLSIKSGNKVLDIGCGTGEITAYIADIVGSEGLCVGVDPDKYRINVAKQKHSLDRHNLEFVLGDSSCDFPHYDEAFYDIVFCNLVFHWLSAQEKVVLLETAFRCLKPDGRIAIISKEASQDIITRVPKLLPDDEINNNRIPVWLVKRSDTEGMLQRAGFEVQSGEYFQHEYTFPSLDHYLSWCCASGYVDESKILPEKKKTFAREFTKDGKIYLNRPMYQIVAKKHKT